MILNTLADHTHDTPPIILTSHWAIVYNTGLLNESIESWKCCTLPRLESINSLQCVHGFDLTGSASLWRGCFPMTLNSNIFGKLPRGSLSTRHAQSWSPKRSNNHHRLHCKNHDHNLTMSTISIQLACQDLLGQKEHAVLSLCSLSFLVS